MKTIAFVLCTFCVLSWPRVGQSASFQNLNFDGANTNNLVDVSGRGDYDGPTSELLPNWQLTVNGQTEIRTGFNLLPPGAGYDTIISPTFIGAYPVIGAYSFAMRPRYEFEFPRGLIPYSLSQSGELPADTKSIHFLSYGAPLQLAVNGSLVPVAYMQRLSEPAGTGTSRCSTQWETFRPTPARP